MSLFENVYMSILGLLLIDSLLKRSRGFGNGQLITISFFILLYCAKYYIYDAIVYYYIEQPDGTLLKYYNPSMLLMNTRFFVANSLTIIQHIFIIVFVIKYSYSDHRAIFPFLTSTMISVLYSISCIVILQYPMNEVVGVELINEISKNNGSRYVQKIIYSAVYFLGSIGMLSLIDYGENIYARVYSKINIKWNSSFGNLFPIVLRSKDGTFTIKKKAC